MGKRHIFGHRPPDVSGNTLGLGWISGIRRIVFSSARPSYWHRHGETALLGCLKGELTYEFHGIAPITLSAGSYLVIPANVEHRHQGEIDPVGRRIELLLDVVPRREPAYSLFPHSVARELHAGILRQALTPVKCGKDLLLAFSELYSLADKPEAIRSEADLGYLRLLVTRILYAATRPHTAPSVSQPMLLDAMLDWIERHLHEPIDIDRIVAKMGYSRTHVFTLFRRQTGLTPAEYIVRQRVRRAGEALKDPTVTSKSVAAACGFATASNFNAVFKRQTGLTPTQWRRRTSAREIEGE